MSDDLSTLEQHFGLPPGLLSAQINAESGGDPNAVGRMTKSGQAIGLAQFMPATAAQYGIDPKDPNQAKLGMAQYDADNLKKYNGDVPLALAAYNWGPGNVDRKGLDQAPPETRNYISKIMGAIGDAIVPPAEAAPADKNNPYSQLSDDQLLAEAQKQGLVPAQQQGVSEDIGASPNLPAGQQVSAQPTAPVDDPKSQVAADVQAEGQPQAQPQASGPNPYAGLTDDQLLGEAKKQGIIPFDNDTKTSMGSKHQAMLGNAQQSMGPNGTGFGLPATLTGYGANIIKAVPGLSEAGSALAALTHQGQGNNFGERYDSLEQSQQAMREAGQQNSPTGTALGQIGATLGTIPALPGVGPSGSALGAIAKNAALGAGYGSLYGADETNSFLPDSEAASQRLDSAESGAKTGAVLGGVLGGVGKAITPAEEVINTSQQAKQAASEFYQQAAKSGQVFPSSFTNDLLKETASQAPQTLAGEATTGSTALKDLIGRWQVLKGKPLDMQSIQEMDEGLGDLIDGQYNTGKLSKQGKQLLDVQTNFRNMIMDQGTQAGSDLSNARAAWSQAMKLSDLERIQTRASLADNPATMIKSGIRTLLSNPARTRGYSAEEISALKQAADRGVIGGIAHVFGSRLIPMGATLVGESVGGLPGAVIGGVVGHGGSSLMRAVGTGIQNNRLQNALATLGKGVPNP